MVGVVIQWLKKLCGGPLHSPRLLFPDAALAIPARRRSRIVYGRSARKESARPRAPGQERCGDSPSPGGSSPRKTRTVLGSNPELLGFLLRAAGVARLALRRGRDGPRRGDGTTRFAETSGRHLLVAPSRRPSQAAHRVALIPSQLPDLRATSLRQGPGQPYVPRCVRDATRRAFCRRHPCAGPLMWWLGLCAQAVRDKGRQRYWSNHARTSTVNAAGVIAVVVAVGLVEVAVVVRTMVNVAVRVSLNVQVFRGGRMRSLRA